MINRLYDEPKSRANSVDVLIHDSFYDRCFACIIQAPLLFNFSQDIKGDFKPALI